MKARKKSRAADRNNLNVTIQIGFVRTIVMSVSVMKGVTS